MADGKRGETWDERILALVPSGVDVTLIEESLRLTPTERLERMLGMLLLVEEARSSGGPGLPRDP